MWTYFIYPACMLAGFLIKVAVEKFSQEAATPEIDKALDARIDKFALGLSQRLDEIYVRRNGSNLTGSEIERRLDKLERRHA